MSTDVAMRLSGVQVYTAFPCLLLFALAAVTPPILNAACFVCAWESYVDKAPAAAYGILIGAAAVALVLVAYLLKITCVDAEHRILTPPEEGEERWAQAGGAAKGPGGEPPNAVSRFTPAPMGPMPGNKVVPVGPGAFPGGGQYNGQYGGGPSGYVDPGAMGMYLQQQQQQQQQLQQQRFQMGGGGYYPSPAPALAARPVTPRTMALFARRNNPGSPARSPMVMQPLPLMDVDPHPAPLPGVPPASEIQPNAPGWNRMGPPKPPSAPRPPAPPPLPPTVTVYSSDEDNDGVAGGRDVNRTGSARAPVSPLHSFRASSTGEPQSAAASPNPWAMASSEIEPQVSGGGRVVIQIATAHCYFHYLGVPC